MREKGYFVAEDGTKIWYGLSGTGPTVVLCDGVGCDGYIWPYIMDHFEDRCSFVRWHYRGHGNSEEPRNLDTLDVPSMVHDLKGILGHLREQGKISHPVILMGHSMGCQVILEYATQYPDDVKAIVPICGSYGRPLDTFLDSGNFKSVFTSLLKVVDRIPNVSGKLWQKAFLNPLSWPIASLTEVNPDLVSRSYFLPYLQHMGRIKPGTFLRTLSFAAEHTTEEHLPHLDFPALVVAGERDNFTPMFLSEKMVEALPNASLHVLPDGTHTAPLETPDNLNEALEGFFSRESLL